MTILPYEKHLSRWQRAKARSEALMDDFRNWCADGNARLPDGWRPGKFEKGCAEVLREMETVMKDRPPES